MATNYAEEATSYAEHTYLMYEYKRKFKCYGVTYPAVLL